MSYRCRKDITGKRFGRLVAIEFVPCEGHNATWKCICDCGNEHISKLSYLQSGDTQSCGCIRKEKHDNKKTLNKIKRDDPAYINPRIIDYSGRLENGILINKFLYRKNNNTYYEMTCFCGNKFIAIPKDIISKKQKSCGCKKNAKTLVKNKIGLKVGMLTCVDYDGIRDGKSYWKCICECGNITSVSSANLKVGQIYSCGCIKESKIYKKVSSLIDKKTIVREYMNENCRYKRKLKFDLYIDEKYFIEVDGMQHFIYKENNRYMMNYKENFKKDMIKNNYCINNNIPLIRIPYYLINIVSKEDLDPSTSIWLIKNHDDIMNYYELEIEYRNKSNKQDFFDRLNEIKESKKGEKNGCKTSI